MKHQVLGVVMKNQRGFIMGWAVFAAAMLGVGLAFVLAATTGGSDQVRIALATKAWKILKIEAVRLQVKKLSNTVTVIEGNVLKTSAGGSAVASLSIPSVSSSGTTTIPTRSIAGQWGYNSLDRITVPSATGGYPQQQVATLIVSSDVCDIEKVSALTAVAVTGDPSVGYSYSFTGTPTTPNTYWCYRKSGETAGLLFVVMQG